VQVFAADGTFVRCLHLPAGTFGTFQTMGVAVTPSGDVVVCDFLNDAIFVD